MLTYAKSINRALEETLLQDERVYLFGEDICDPYGGAFKITKGLSSRFPERIYNTPISEASITGIVAGMAVRGFRPVLEIMFGDFLSLAADQILSNISKFHWMYNHKVAVPVVIRTPMGGRRGYGPTHSQSIEKMFLGIPGIKIVAPSYFHDVGDLLKIAIQDDDPVLFIEHKLDYSRTLKTIINGRVDDWFARYTGDVYPVISLSLTDFEDDDVTIITYGGMVPFVEDAAKKLLFEEDIATEILIPSLIKPLNVNELIPSVSKTGRVVIVEEGTLTNGWGAEIAALLSDEGFKYLKAPVKRIAALDFPIANTKILEDFILPDTEDIVQTVKEIL